MNNICPVQEFMFTKTVPFNSIVKIMASIVDIKNETIVEAVVDTARKEGITDLILMDKEFILRAIKNELEKFMEEV